MINIVSMPIMMVGVVTATKLKREDGSVSLQITGIRKPGGAQNPHEAISHYGWRKDSNGETGISERLEVINYLEANRESAYVSVGGNMVWCDIRVNEHGTKFLQTYADNKYNDNLLSLPPI